MIADIMAKPITGEKLKRLGLKLMNHVSSASRTSQITSIYRLKNIFFSKNLRTIAHQSLKNYFVLNNFFLPLFKKKFNILTFFLNRTYDFIRVFYLLIKNIFFYIFWIWNNFLVCIFFYCYICICFINIFVVVIYNIQYNIFYFKFFLSNTFFTNIIFGSIFWSIYYISPLILFYYCYYYQ